MFFGFSQCLQYFQRFSDSGFCHDFQITHPHFVDRSDVIGRLAGQRAACDQADKASTPTTAPSLSVSPTPPLSPLIRAAEAPTPVVIAEVLAGVQGNNNYEFIELYNRSSQIVDIQGWALWYRLATSREDVFIYRWTAPTLIPPYGHLLLGLAEQDLGLPVDAEYETPINTSGGGLQLRQTDGAVLDMLGWGKAPENFYEGQPAPAMENGVALERGPGGDLGNAADSDDNAADFALQQTPNPQNTASQMTPLSEQRLEMAVSAPANAEPGSDLSICSPSPTIPARMSPMPWRSLLCRPS
jgi:hypothetical protein